MFDSLKATHRHPFIIGTQHAMCVSMRVCACVCVCMCYDQHAATVSGMVSGRIKKPSAAATKQWARQVRRQQRAQEQSDDDSPQPAAQTTTLHWQRSNLGSNQRASATSTLLAAIHMQDKADKYIDRILRKQGGRLHKLKAVPVASASLQASKASQRGSQHATNSVMAELQALGRQQPENEDMYESEQDHYFSEEDS